MDLSPNIRAHSSTCNRSWRPSHSVRNLFMEKARVPEKFFAPGPSQVTLFQVASIGSVLVFVQACEGNSFSNSVVFQAKFISNLKGKCKRAAYIFSSQPTPACVRTFVYYSINHLVYQFTFSSSNSPQFIKRKSLSVCCCLAVEMLDAECAMGKKQTHGDCG